MSRKKTDSRALASDKRTSGKGGKPVVDWKGKFDRIWCISYTGYPERRKSLERELERVGILGSGVFEWHYTFKSIFDNILFDVTKGAGANETVNATITSVALAHYHCIRASYELGDRRCLILEDDIRFLEDAKTLKEIFDDMPSNADIVLFDHTWNDAEYNDPGEYSRNRSGLYETVNGHFRRYGMLLGGGCYALSRAAMKTIVESYERKLAPADSYMSRITVRSGLVRVAACPRAAIQVEFGKSNCTELYGERWVTSMYQADGVDFSLYSDNMDGIERRKNPIPTTSSGDGVKRRYADVWRSKFDRIWCLGFTGYPDRFPPLVSELDRVGILDSGLLEWKVNFPTCLNDILYDVTKAIGCNEVVSKGVLSSVFGHYHCVKASLELGDERILVLEDDVRFLKDADKVVSTVSALRDDSDIVLFDYLGVWNGDEDASRRTFAMQRDDRVDDVFSRYRLMYSAACYSLSRRAMSDIVERCERKLHAFDWYLSELAGNTSLNMHFPTDQTACQLPPVGKSSNNDMNFGVGATRKLAEFAGTDFSLFNI